MLAMTTRIKRVGTRARGFQHLQNQRIGRTQVFAAVGGELTYLIDLTAVGILVGHRQHLVLVQRLFEADITQRSIQGIFA